MTIVMMYCLQMSLNTHSFLSNTIPVPIHFGLSFINIKGIAMNLITKNIYSLFAAAITFNTNYVFAEQSTIDSIELASQQHNLSELTEIAKNAAGYDAALVNYRLAIAHNIMGETEKALALLDIAQAALLDDKLGADKSEANALLAQVYGYRISIKPITGFYYGIKSNNALNNAVQINKSNPRAHLVKGIIALNTPSMFGGSKQQALSSLNASLIHYQNDNNDGYKWGQAEAYVWRGLTYLALNDVQKAVQDWQTSLDLAPNYIWPKVLINNNKQ
jgi:tetratricopeptide (TPR) repeat protein